MKKYQLMAPGPTPVPSEVLLAMAQPMLHHRTPEYEALFLEVRAGLKQLFQTAQDVLPLACSGTGAMEAAAVIFFLSPLRDVLASAGERGYRLVNLEAGIAGGRAYLAAYAHGFGASGLTFYDADVVEFFSPHAAGKDAVFVTALGRGTTAAGDILLSTALTAPPGRS